MRLEGWGICPFRYHTPYSVQYDLPTQRDRAQILGGTGSNASNLWRKDSGPWDHVDMQPTSIQYHFLNQVSSDNPNISSYAKIRIINLARANSLARIYITYQISRADTVFIHPIMKPDGDPSTYRAFPLDAACHTNYLQIWYVSCASI